MYRFAETTQSISNKRLNLPLSDGSIWTHNQQQLTNNQKWVAEDVHPAEDAVQQRMVCQRDARTMVRAEQEVVINSMCSTGSPIWSFQKVKRLLIA